MLFSFSVKNNWNYYLQRNKIKSWKCNVQCVSVPIFPSMPHGIKYVKNSVFYENEKNNFFLIFKLYIKIIKRKSF